MDPDVARIAQILTVVVTFAGVVIAIGLVVRNVLYHTRRTINETQTPRVDEDRFTRLEDAVESIALEVERIAEAQRFSAKLLNDRLPERQPDRLSERGGDIPR